MINLDERFDICTCHGLDFPEEDTEIGLLNSPTRNRYNATVYKHHRHNHNSGITPQQVDEATKIALENLNALRERAFNGEDIQKELLLALENLFHLEPISALEHLGNMRELLIQNAELCNLIYKMQDAIQNGEIIPVPGGKGVIIIGSP